jgi:hypothetical protein
MLRVLPFLAILFIEHKRVFPNLNQITDNEREALVRTVVKLPTNLLQTDWLFHQLSVPRR